MRKGSERAANGGGLDSYYQKVDYSEKRRGRSGEQQTETDQKIIALRFEYGAILAQFIINDLTMEDIEQIYASDEHEEEEEEEKKRDKSLDGIEEGVKQGMKRLREILNEIEQLRLACLPYMKNDYYVGLSLRMKQAPDASDDPLFTLFYNGGMRDKGVTHVMTRGKELKEYCEGVYNVIQKEKAVAQVKKSKALNEIALLMKKRVTASRNSASSRSPSPDPEAKRPASKRQKTK